MGEILALSQACLQVHPRGMLNQIHLISSMKVAVLSHFFHRRLCGAVSIEVMVAHRKAEAEPTKFEVSISLSFPVGQ